MPQPINPGLSEKLLADALSDIRFGLDFAYEHGLHEFGYDPLATVSEALSRIPPVDEALLASVKRARSVIAQYRHGEDLERGDFDLDDIETLIDAALSRTPPVEPGDSWQPIETAPKNEWVLAAEEPFEAGPYDAYAAHWTDEGYWMARCGQYVTQSPEPTHWRPLPAPPASQSGETPCR